MGQKIERDHQRFRKIVRGKVKSNLSKYISRGEMIGKKGKDLVSASRCRRSTSRSSATARRAPAASARARASVGQPLGPAAGRRRAGGRRSAGRPHPRSRADHGGAGRDPRRGAGPAAHRAARQEEHRHRRRTSTPASARPGPESLRHFKRTFKRALKRQIASGTYDPSDPIVIPIREDKQYRSWKEVPEAAERSPSSST